MRQTWRKPMLGLLLLAAAPACTTLSGHKADEGPEPAEINTQLGVEYLRKGMYEASSEKLLKALDQNPRYAPAHDAIAVLYEQLGEVDKADSHYRRSLALDDNNAATMNNYGQFLCRHGKLEKAEAYFQKALKDPLYRYPEMVNTNAGICVAKVPDMERAEKYFRTALEINELYLPAIREMARVSFATGNYLGARAYLQRYEVQAKLGADLLWLAVLTEDKLGDRDTSASYALLLKKGFPDSPQARELDKWEHERNR